ncbi:MAG: hypothetical protein LBI67_01655 [Treponema sp.]|jgi:hypothetical protein|nr:hypothetical protein [Treponema sp.]
MTFSFRRGAPLASLIFFVFPAAGTAAQDVLRGEVRLDLEPVYGFFMDEIPGGLVRTGAMEAPLDYPEAGRRAAREAAVFFSAMIYGWSFHYDIGERARGIEEELELTPLGSVSAEDPRFQITETQVKEMRLYLWSDYRPGEEEKRRLSMWKKGLTRSAQGLGHGPLGYAPLPRSDGSDGMEDEGDEDPPWLAVKKEALEDAARSAIRAMLRGSERNRPKAAEGFISLAAFPRFWLDAGQWAAAGRFLVNVTEITPFGAH